ncbi:hypothetical protein Q7P37_008897 [Cladosporium fusiforme]
MKLFSARHEYNYSWEEVSTNNWRKYCPWNDKAEHVIGVDVLSRSLDQTTGILRTERLITCKQALPNWLKSFFGSNDTSIVYEVSYVNPKEKSVTMCSQNLTWNELLSVQETVRYTPSQNPGKTNFDQTAKIIALCGGWQKIKNSIEDVTVDRFSKNAAKGREGFERVLAISREAFAEQRRQSKLAA